MSELVRFTVDRAEAGRRVDVVLPEQAPGLSRSAAQELLRLGQVTVNGKPTRSSHRLAAGDEVTARIELPPSLTAEPEDIPLNVVYQDDDLAVIDKPAGLVVHPAAGHVGGTMANALAALFPEARDVGPGLRPGIVHRLDKDTSGLMVVALNRTAQVSLQQQIASRTAQRQYLALATGHMPSREAVIDAPIGRDAGDRKRMAVHGIAARPARTSYRVVSDLPGSSLLEVRLDTGRTHQIRVHLAAIGHPVVGDQTYHGGVLPRLHRQFLHAYHLELDSPSTGTRLVFSSPLPADLQAVLKSLEERA